MIKQFNTEVEDFGNTLFGEDGFVEEVENFLVTSEEEDKQKIVELC